VAVHLEVNRFKAEVQRFSFFVEVELPVNGWSDRSPSTDLKFPTMPAHDVLEPLQKLGVIFHARKVILVLGSLSKLGCHSFIPNFLLAISCVHGLHHW